MRIYRIPILRRVILPFLKRFSFDFHMRNPWVPGAKIKLNSFLHKGYWYHGRRRENESMQLFGRLVDAGATVVEVGGHIGWISAWLASCVGPGGRVFVFEPGSNNLPYTRINLSEGLPAHLSAVVRLVEAAVGEKEDIVSFYEDALTGQNNSIVENFEGLNANQSMAFVDANVQRRVVRLVSLDSQLPEEAVSFVKVDVEGYEWGVLQGAKKLIDRCLPSMMVEVQCNHDEIFSYLTDMGYMLFDPNLKLLSSADALQSNVFCLHRVKHKTQISELGILLS